MNGSLKEKLVRNAEQSAAASVLHGSLGLHVAINAVQSAIQPMQAEEQLIVILAALRGRVAQLGAAPQFDALREELDNQILQLHDARRRLTVVDEPADLGFAEPGHAAEFALTSFGGL
jgi:hypothetical protein